MQYTLSVTEPGSHYIDVVCQIDKVSGHMLDLQLPAWRPGRYELQHFAKNIRRFAVFDQNGQPLVFRKTTKDRWQVRLAGATTVQVRYDYYGLLPGDHKLDAGSSYADPAHFWYINPINLCVYAEGRLTEPCTLTLNVPGHWQIACGLPRQNSNTLLARDYHQLVDSPLIASDTVQAIRYSVQGVDFTIWVQGWHYHMPPAFRPEQLVHDFTRFSEVQLDLFGEFPEREYHFLTLVLPVPYYHGVEHRNSTVLVLGPELEGVDEQGNKIGDGLYTDLLGVASHELFHAWNICRIRPAELLPYDYTRENYFTTCFVAEGLTTYYGDLLLRRSGVFDEATYLKELLVILKRHFENAGRAYLSLTEASWDLWLDGYVRGVPNRKVSVYHKGAIAALMLDLYLRRKFRQTRSLDDVMRLLWVRFGKPFVGYTYADYRATVAEVANEPMNWYFDLCITGNAPLEEPLNALLADVGLRLIRDKEGVVSVLEVA
jgi:predicted metalloprotease with PDZ domain